LATGHIALLSPLAAVSGFVRQVHCAGTFACGSYATKPLLKNSLSPGGIWTPSWDAHASNGISIGSAVFAQLTRVTDRQTDRPRYVRRIYALRPSNV